MITYKYIDDRDDLRVIIECFNEKYNGTVNISFENCKDTFEEQVDYIDCNISNIDGFILDIDLAKRYDGKSLVQYIRNCHSNKPVIAFSSNDIISNKVDDINKSFFDLIFDKQDTNCLINNSKKILDLHDIYIVDILDIQELLNVRIEWIDSRILSYWRDFISHLPKYLRVRFIIDAIVSPCGDLIDELVLASRLGVNINSSCDEWGKLLKMIDKYRFVGMLSNGWERWWMSGILNWWAEISDIPLRYISAQERVKIINNKFNLNLKAAEPMEGNKSTEFWSICQLSRNPIDPTEGFIIHNKAAIHFPWLDLLYVSGNYAIKDAGYSEDDIDDIDKNRFRNLINSLNNGKKQ